MPPLPTFDVIQADKDPVIQIANIVKVQGSDDVVAKNVFTLGGCTPIVDAHVITNHTEDEMLLEVSILNDLDGLLSCADFRHVFQ